ncbi:MAG: hypothetical protein JF567_11050 [Xanthomonadales bacterium]|nr:hypothetical protein [Xanthomonadales bacterium]
MTAALPDRQHLALRNLARKNAGEEVGWINIADAIALAEAGLCRRTAEGWKITTEGQALLAVGPDATPPDSSDVVPMFANDAKSRD